MKRAKTLVVVCALWVVAGTAPALGQEPSNDALQLSVKVKAYPGQVGTPATGSGFIIGVDDTLVYVAAAEHVVRRASGNEDGYVTVTFFGNQALEVPASVKDTSRAEDIAVLTVTLENFHGEMGKTDFQGRVDDRQPVFPVGCAVSGLGCWTPPVAPDYVAGQNQREIRFQTNLGAKGHSGGALWNDQGEIVGMITRVAGSLGTATTIDRVIRQLDDWGVPTDLHPPSVPRAGYDVVFEAQFFGFAKPDSILGPSGESLVDKITRRFEFPSARAAVSLRFARGLSVHVSGLRLAPHNLAIYGAMVGIGLRCRGFNRHCRGTGRWSVDLFGEVGGGRIEGQYDAGGFVFDQGGEPEYQPFWTRAENDGVGFGGGARIRYIVYWGLAIEAMAAHWDFSRPDGLPGMPWFFFGGGISKGF